MKLRLSLLKNLLKSGGRHKKGYVCPKTGLKVSTPPEKCIKIKYEESSKEEIIFVPVDRYLLEFARSRRSKLK